jgi:heme/copper-type cytochrome/quinol oxidase subunit 3
MNDNTTKLLNDLAEKLSTTSDKLWAMLLHQARIQFWTNLIIYAAFALISCALYRTCRHLFTRADKDDQFEMPATIAVIISIIFVGVCCYRFPDYLAGHHLRSGQPRILGAHSNPFHPQKVTS